MNPVEWVNLKTIRGKFLIPTFILTVIPMIVLSFVFYHIAQAQIGKNANEHAYASLRMGEHYLEQLIVDLYDLTNVMMSNKQMQTILLNAPKDDYEYIKNVSDVQKLMNGIIHAKPYITSYIIYSNRGKSDMRVYNGTSGTMLSDLLDPAMTKSVYNNLVSNGPIQWIHWRSPIEYSRPMESMVVTKLLKDMDDGIDDLGFLALQIDKMAFFKGLSFLQPDKESQFFILNHNNELLFQVSDLHTSTGSSKLLPVLVKSLQQTEANIYYKGKKYIFSKVTNAKTGWKLIHMVEATRLYRDAASIRQATILVFVLLFIAGSLVAFALSNSVSRPLKHMFKLIQKNTGVPPNDPPDFNPNDEVGQIGFQLLRMMETNYTLNRQVVDELLRRKEAEIEALQSQINPHFLYNTLETLNWLAISRDQYEISEVVSSLGKFFRIAISKGKDMITLAEELEHVQAYLKVQIFRYKDKFECVIEIDQELKMCYVPKIILQPLVENAIYHGLKLQQGRGTIMISAEQEGEDIVLRVTDDGIGIPHERKEEIRNDLETDQAATIYGLKNVHDRLRLMFGPEYGISISSEIGYYTTVTLKLPRRNVPKGGILC